MWSVFMLIKFGVIYMTLTILQIKLKQTIWKIKMHNTELNPISDRGCRFKNSVHRSGVLRAPENMPNTNISTRFQLSTEN